MNAEERNELLERAKRRIQAALKKAELERKGAIAIAVAIDSNDVQFEMLDEGILIYSRKLARNVH